MVIQKGNIVMKEMKVTYTLKEDGNECSVLRKVQGISDLDTDDVFSLIFADIITAFKESGMPKNVAKEMMNNVVDVVYQMHPKHTKI